MAQFAPLPASRSTLARLYALGELPTLSRVAIQAAWVVAIWSQRARTRKSLARLSDEQLRDIGLSRDAASIETKKAFWTP